MAKKKSLDEKAEEPNNLTKRHESDIPPYGNQVGKHGPLTHTGRGEDDDDSDEIPLAKPMGYRGKTSSTISTASAKRKLHVSPLASKRRSDAMVISDNDDDHSLAFVSRRGCFRSSEDNDEEEVPAAKEEDTRLPTKRRCLDSGSLRASNPHISKDEGTQTRSLRSARPRRTKARAVKAQKMKALELLRRRRSGEMIDEDDGDDDSESEEEARPLYDPDPEHVALDKFYDDEEGVPDFVEPPRTQRRQRQARCEDHSGSDSDSDDMRDFVMDDKHMQAPEHAPERALLNMPLEFTAHSHKRPSHYFKNIVEWLVQFHIDPNFADKADAGYKMAWQKLDDEVAGLAMSKFTSGAWKKDFYMALRARPRIECAELRTGQVGLDQTCEACGRTRHPAKWKLTFTGAAYYKKFGAEGEGFLEPVEDESTDSGENKIEEGKYKDGDEDGNAIAKQTKSWWVGVVCQSNASTAHGLIHWKPALKKTVGEKLRDQGYLTVVNMDERRRWGDEAKSAFVDGIIQKWNYDGTSAALWTYFKRQVEGARTKDTRGVRA